MQGGVGQGPTSRRLSFWAFALTALGSWCPPSLTLKSVCGLKHTWPVLHFPCPSGDFLTLLGICVPLFLKCVGYRFWLGVGTLKLTCFELPSMTGNTQLFWLHFFSYFLFYLFPASITTSSHMGFYLSLKRAKLMCATLPCSSFILEGSYSWALHIHPMCACVCRGMCAYTLSMSGSFSLFKLLVPWQLSEDLPFTPLPRYSVHCCFLWMKLSLLLTCSGSVSSGSLQNISFVRAPSCPSYLSWCLQHLTQRLWDGQLPLMPQSLSLSAHH